jgi:hypothetical protein
MIVLLDVWTVRTSAVAKAFWHMARDPRALAGVPGLTFHKSLGTGAGKRFTAADADVRQWALLTCWNAHAEDSIPVWSAWERMAVSHTRFAMSTIASHGQWSGREPFPADPDSRTWQGPVAAITRARVRTSRWREFQRAVPPVAGILDDCPGLLFRIGIGEAPIGLQGTFSVWESAADLKRFAYGTDVHREVIEQTHRRDWYSEDLFARFAVREVQGHVPW